MLENQQSHKLKVLSGIHKNAELVIRNDTTYQVGSSETCDIVLRDDDIKANHITISTSNGKLFLKKDGACVYLDGKRLEDSNTALHPYQIVTVGQTHLSLGPLDENWPTLKLPLIEINPVVPGNALSGDVEEDNKDKTATGWWQKTELNIPKANNKIALSLCLCLFIFFIFWVEVMQPEVAAGTRGASKRTSVGSLLAEMSSAAARLRDASLVSTGLEEPDIHLVKKKVKTTDRLELVRNALNKNWRDSIVERQTDSRNIRFKGYDANSVQDLDLRLNRLGHNTLRLSGYTRSKHQKQDIIVELADVIDVEINAADDIERVCGNILEKKGVKNGKGVFDIQDQSLRLDGVTNDQKMISAIPDVISRVLPGIHILNGIQYRLKDRLNITGVNNAGLKHVTMADGKKLYVGGKLDNGCVILKIALDYLDLDCDGAEIKYSIGGD